MSRLSTPDNADVEGDGALGCDVAGLAALSAAGFVVAVWLGLALLGVAFLALSWRLSHAAE
jgi:hypothetical protein